MAEPERRLPPMKIIADRYQVLGELGSGGISTVYKVRDTESDRTMALKRVEPNRKSEEELLRFSREFRFLSRIQHPNIVQVYDTGLDGSLPFFTMEYLEGQTLAQLLTEPDRGYALALKRDPTTLSNFLGQICRALSYMHEKGTVHRDIKPSNLMILPDGPTSNVKILDLGLAKFRDAEPGQATQSAQVLGTVHYSAPEQIRNLNVDGRADLYSLGAILYEIMTGRRPFGGDSAVSVAMQHLNELPVPPRVHDLDVPHHIQLIVMKLLEKDPDRRYRSPEDLLIDFNDPDVVDDIEEPAVAAPPLLLHPRFLGRREPAAEARAMMTELRSGTGCVLTVAGEPGIGKTRFLNELCADAKVMGHQVLSGTCYRDSKSPYQPIVTAIRDGLGERSLWNWIDRDDRFPLARLFPELKDESVAAIPDEYQNVDQGTIVAALIRLLESASRNSPIILCVDDIQWIDEASLAVLAALADRVDALPVAILAGHRPFESDPPDFLPKKPDIPLSPLPRDFTRDLIASILGSLDVQEELVSEVYGVSDGNPFSAIESIRSLEEIGVLKWKRNQWNYTGIGNDLPERVEWLVNQRIARLSGRRREILEWACVLGRPFNFTLIEACDFGEEAKVQEDLTWLTRHNALRLSGPDTYDVFHARIGEAILASLPEERLQSIHLAVADALALKGTDPEEIGRHLIKAGQSSRAVPYVVEASEKHERLCSFATGTALLESVASALIDTERVDILLRLARLYELCGRLENATEALERIDKGNLTEIQLVRFAATSAAIRPFAESSVLELEDNYENAVRMGEHQAALGCLLALIKHSWRNQDREQARKLLQRAEEVCDRMGGQFYAAYTEYLRGNILLEEFDLGGAKRAFQSAHTVFSEVNHLFYKSASAMRLIEICYYRGEFTEARSLKSEVTTAADASIVSTARYFLALIALAENNLSEASDEISQAIGAKENLGPMVCLIYGLGAVINRMSGQSDQCSRYFEKAEELSEQHTSKKSALLRLQAESSTRGGDTMAAFRYLQAAAEASAGNTIQEAFTSLDLGRNLSSQGEYKEALPLLDKVRHYFGQSEAFHLENLALAELKHIEKATSESRSKTRPRTQMAEKSMNNSDQVQLLDEIVENLVQFTRCQRAILAVYDDADAAPILVKASGLGNLEITDISSSVLRRVVAEGSEIISHDAVNDPRFSQTASIANSEIRSVVCVPVPTQEKLAAGLYVDHIGVDYFDEVAVDHLRSLARLAGLAIARSHRYDQLRDDVDRITGMGARYQGIVGTGERMQTVFDLMDKVCDSEIPVLIVGETGTGKGLVARTIHEKSRRAGSPFVAQNLGAMSLNLLETELFGHAKGAFTGADYERPGLFEAAHDGTIFLDEIGDAPAEVQIRLLQVIEEGTVRRVGENQTRSVNVRILAATHKDLDAEVAAGRFREDLLFRLRVVPIPIPALRERREDIVLLAHHFMAAESARMGWETKGLSEDVLKLFESYSWPGNIRELENEIRRGLTLSGKSGRVETRHLSDNLSNSTRITEMPEPGDFKSAVNDFERQFILNSLTMNDWNVTRTSEILGLTRVGLQRKLKRLGINRPKT